MFSIEVYQYLSPKNNTLNIGFSVLDLRFSSYGTRKYELRFTGFHLLQKLLHVLSIIKFRKGFQGKVVDFSKDV